MSTNNAKKHSDLKKTAFTILLLALVVVFIAIFTGCSVKQVDTPMPKASKAATFKDTPEAVVEEEPENTGVVAFGDVITYADEISLSVSAPADYVPTEWAAGMVEGQPTVVFEFVITNGSSEPFAPEMVFATLSSAGVEASGVFDTENNIGFPPTTSVLPGQTIKWNQAWSVADPAVMTMDISAGFTYDNAIFTNIQ